MLHLILDSSSRFSVQSALSCWLTPVLWGTTWSCTRVKNLISVSSVGRVSVRKVMSEVHIWSCSCSELSVVLKACLHRRFLQLLFSIVHRTCTSLHSACVLLTYAQPKTYIHASSLFPCIYSVYVSYWDQEIKRYKWAPIGTVCGQMFSASSLYRPPGWYQ